LEKFKHILPSKQIENTENCNISSDRFGKYFSTAALSISSANFINQNNYIPVFDNINITTLQTSFTFQPTTDADIKLAFTKLKLSHKPDVFNLYTGKLKIYFLQ